MSTIPSVSLESLMSSDAEVISHLENSLENIGFFILKDHGLDLNLVRDAFSLSKKLFNLPFEIKKKYHVEGSNGARGYTPYGIETALNENVPDQKEFWHQGSTTNQQLMPNLYHQEQMVPLHQKIPKLLQLNHNYHHRCMPRLTL